MEQQLKMVVGRMNAGDVVRDQDFHRRRAHALHAMLDQAAEIEVVQWGYTDDVGPHEFVEVVALLKIVGAAKAVTWLGKKLVDKGVDAAFSKAIDYLFEKITDEQKHERLGEVTVTLPDGTKIQVNTPPGEDVDVSIWYADGQVDMHIAGWSSSR